MDRLNWGGCRRRSCLATDLEFPDEEDRVPVVRALVGVALLAGAFRARTRCIQSIELAEAVEDLGADGAYFRVHHFAQQLASPFPLLAAIGARTKRIEIGTAVIDMRYENPLYMVEDAGAADLIAGGRLQLGISRGSPEQVIDGFRYFGYAPADGKTDADMARDHAEVFLEALSGVGFAEPNPSPMFPNPPGLLRLEPHSPGLRDRIWWGAGTRATAEWTGQQGMNLMSSTLLTEDAGVPFHELQAKQIRLFRAAWTAAGHQREPRVSVSRSIFALVDDRDRAYFGRGNQDPTRSATSMPRPRRSSGARTPRSRTPWSRARQGHGDPGGRHAPADGPEPARRRVQRARHGEHPEVRGAGAWLALAPSFGKHAHHGLQRSEVSMATAIPHVDILAAAWANDAFRREIATGEHEQVVVMTIPPGGEIGDEVHPDTDQVLLFIEGRAEATLDGRSSEAGPNDMVFVPAGTRHNFVNRGEGSLRLITIYAPPEHAAGTVHQTKAEADAAEQ